MNLAALGAENERFETYIQGLVDPSLTWDVMDWLRSVTSLPILVKGILTAADAVLACERGADGIFVSNHGARQLDTVPATIEVLPEIADAVRGRAEILLDGGIRRGTDVVKAVALGARAVAIGRPCLYGLAVSGEEGVRHVFELLRTEVELAMALLGCARASPPWIEASCGREGPGVPPIGKARRPSRAAAPPRSTSEGTSTPKRHSVIGVYCRSS